MLPGIGDPNGRLDRAVLRGLKYFEYYVNIAGTEEKLRRILKTFAFTTVSEALGSVTKWQTYRLANGEISRDGTS